VTLAQAQPGQTQYCVEDHAGEIREVVAQGFKWQLAGEVLGNEVQRLGVLEVP